MEELRVDGKPFGLQAFHQTFGRTPSKPAVRTPELLGEALWHAPPRISERITRERFMPPLQNSLNCGRSGKPLRFSRAFARQNVDGEIDQTAGSRTLENQNQHRVKAFKVIAEPEAKLYLRLRLGLGTAFRNLGVSGSAITP